MDGEVFEISCAAARVSALLASMIDDEDDEKVIEIPLPNVRGRVLALVAAFCKEHANSPMPEIEKPLKCSNLSEVVSQWDSDFVDIEMELLSELMVASNYLDLKCLLHLTCAKVALMIRGLTPKEIRKQFNLVNDFTPAEEDAVRKGNTWIDK